MSLDSSHVAGPYIKLSNSGVSFGDIGSAYGAINNALPTSDVGINARSGNAVHIGTNNLPRVTVTSTGAVGIGTTAPSAPLSVTASSSLLTDFNSTSGAGGYLRFQNSASTYADIGSANQTFGGHPIADFGINVRGGNNLKLGTNSSPRITVNGAGSIQFNAYGAGTLTTDASGNITAASDERLKTIDAQFTRGLDALMGITPISYHWKPETLLDTEHQYSGFSAQNVHASIPEAIGTDPRGYMTISDRPILAAVVNAIKDIASVTGSFRQHLISWLASTDNGVAAVSAKQLCLSDDGGSSCYTRAQLDALFASGTTTPPASAPGTQQQGDTESPVVTLAGSAEQSIPMGTQWSDLGATATDNMQVVGDVTASLNGATSVVAGLVTIDTAVPGSYTIVYTARDEAGNIGTATRVVTVIGEEVAATE
jgi:hypothetical protein